MAPPILAYRVHSLPPILHMQAQNPMSSYSKGAQGLSVFLRVHGIFTATAISPSLWPRQCGDRYAIRAGRNLPDKEFRYLGIGIRCGLCSIGGRPRGAVARSRGAVR